VRLELVVVGKALLGLLENIGIIMEEIYVTMFYPQLKAAS